MVGVKHRGLAAASSARGRLPGRALLERDAALARLARTRRLLLVCAAALTAGIAALVSAVAPGRSAGAGHHARNAVAVTPAVKQPFTAPTMPPAANAAQLGLAGPSEGPAPAPQATPDPSQSSAAAAAQPTPSAAQTPQPAAVSGGS